MNIYFRRCLAAAVIGLAAALAPAGAPVTGGITIGANEEELEAMAEHEDGEAGPAGADQWFVAQRTFPSASVDIGQSHRAALAQAGQLSTGVSAAAAWQSLGPANIGGRVTDLAVDPTRTDTVYAGAATGGVWKSVDAGRTFVSAWNAALAPSIGALAIAPTNANRTFAAAAGSLFVPGGPRGLYRTTNGGATWQLVLAGSTATTGAIDVAIDPATPSRVYAAMWDHQRRPEGRIYGGTGSGIYRSTDGGTTWTRLGGGLPSASSNLGRMGIAVARSNPNRLYAIAANTAGNFLGFWTSTNAGSSWTRITNTTFLSDSQSTYGWWFGRIWIDPAASR